MHQIEIRVTKHNKGIKVQQVVDHKNNKECSELIPILNKALNDTGDQYLSMHDKAAATLRAHFHNMDYIGLTITPIDRDDQITEIT